MPRFSINVSMMLQEFSFLDRFQAAADLGFTGVDIQFPYAFPADAVARAARRAGVDIVLINVPAGDLSAGGDGLACVPGREAEFARAVEKAADYASALGVKRVNVLSGRVPEGAVREEAMSTLISNLQLAADRFALYGVTVMVEPCNGRDVPRYLVQRTGDAIDAIDKAGRNNLAVQFDLYHRQIMEGDLIEGFRAALPRIAHVQFADTPGRHEPGTGEINYRTIFAAIDASGYAGWVGAEYRPTATTAASLDWLLAPL
ncbi:MAG: hydroxypyruvate isomerase family protein [Aliihoeflea sp.]